MKWERVSHSTCCYRCASGSRHRCTFGNKASKSRTSKLSKACSPAEEEAHAMLRYKLTPPKKAHLPPGCGDTITGGFQAAAGQAWGSCLSCLCHDRLDHRNFWGPFQPHLSYDSITKLAPSLLVKQCFSTVTSGLICHQDILILVLLSPSFFFFLTKKIEKASRISKTSANCCWGCAAARKPSSAWIQYHYQRTDILRGGKIHLAGGSIFNLPSCNQLLTNLIDWSSASTNTSVEEDMVCLTGCIPNLSSCLQRRSTQLVHHTNRNHTYSRLSLIHYRAS